MSASDDEDDFMSDKFLAPVPSSSSKPSTYADKRKAAALASLRKVKESHQKPQWQLEKEAREKGLQTSLLEPVASGSAAPVSKAMGMMLKMGWKPGEGLGRKEDGVREAEDIAGEQEEHDDRPSHGGIGSHAGEKRKRSASPTKGGRVEPIRVSMWAGRAGIGTKRSPSPDLNTVLPPGGTELPPSKLAKLTESTDGFRARQQKENEAKRVEGREWASRKLLMEFDEANGIAFHPLHIIPSKPLQTIPPPLLHLLFPDLPDHHPPLPGIQSSTLESNQSEAQRLKEQMRLDALGDLSDEEGPELLMGGKERVKVVEEKVDERTEEEKERDAKLVGVDWVAQVPGAKRVLQMDPATHLAFVISSLREDHLYCFWCAAKYGSHEEMEGAGGCPGEDEDDH